MDAMIRHKLLTAAIGYDRRESNLKRYNRYALGIYCKSLTAVAEDVDKGTSLARALYDHFNGRLLTVLENAVGLPPTYGGGGRDRGRPD